MFVSREPHIKLAIYLLYTIHFLKRRKIFFRFLLVPPLKLIYKCYTLFFLSLDLPTSVRIGKNLNIHHGFGLVISSRSTIGNNVVLRQNTTLGVVDEESMGPTLLDNVQVGANAIILGAITIGEGSVIGAGAVVTKNVPPHSIVIGNPGKIVSQAKNKH